MHHYHSKRLLDLSITIPALILLAPLLALVACLVRIKLGAPILFRQQRPGLHGRPFMMLKFRTMTDACDTDGNLLPDTERLTRFGRFLRSTSLDELPELINVLRGEMSLVGPRPLLMRYTPYFTAQERSRFLVRPGITGWAQIKGRNDLSWDLRLAADIEYVHSCSFALDACIIGWTLLKVIRREGLQIDPGAIMLDFDEERRQHGMAGLHEAIR